MRTARQINETCFARQYIRQWHAIGLVLALLINNGSNYAVAQSAEPDGVQPKGKQWAVLIGIEKYQRAPRLRYTLNDVVKLSETLRKRGGLKASSILEITDTAKNPAFRPLRDNMTRELPKWFEKPGANDDIIVYFSGHGVRDANGKLYLAPIDCDPANPVTTGIPIRWLREQIAGCKAKSKLLVIDACHAGTEKGTDNSTGIPAGDLAEQFRDLAGVVTLASSKADEKSQLWEDKEHSLFTFWLIQALKGHADIDGNAAVDIDELNKYLHRNVTRTAKLRFPRPQTPVRIVRSGTPGVPVVIRLRPQGLTQILTDMAEQLALAMEEAKQGRVGVAEFTVDTKYGELLGAEFGLLGRYCAKELERRLMDLGAGKFSVVDHRRLQNELSRQGYSIDDLYKTKSLSDLANRTGGMPVIALGTLSNRQGREITLRCRLTKTNGVDVIASVGGMAKLNLSEWGMLGHSAELRPDDLKPIRLGAKPTKPLVDHVVEVLDKRSKEPHPLLQKGFPFPVQIRVNGEIRKPVVQGNELLIPLRVGEVFDVVVENRTDQLAFLRLLVDGLNTLPQRVNTKALDWNSLDPADRHRYFERQTEKGVVLMEVAPRVNLAQARPWVLDPSDRKKWFIRGFVTETGVQGKLRKFTVVSADKSLAAKKRFADAIGLITFAFHAKSGETRGQIGTDLGDEDSADLQERDAGNVGNPLAMFHLRYVDADSLQTTGQ